MKYSSLNKVNHIIVYIEIESLFKMILFPQVEIVNDHLI